MRVGSAGENTLTVIVSRCLELRREYRTLLRYHYAGKIDDTIKTTNSEKEVTK